MAKRCSLFVFFLKHTKAQEQRSMMSTAWLQSFYHREEICKNTTMMFQWVLNPVLFGSTALTSDQNHHSGSNQITVHKQLLPVWQEFSSHQVPKTKVPVSDFWMKRLKPKPAFKKKGGCVCEMNVVCSGTFCSCHDVKPSLWVQIAQTRWHLSHQGFLLQTHGVWFVCIRPWCSSSREGYNYFFHPRRRCDIYYLPPSQLVIFSDWIVLIIKQQVRESKHTDSLCFGCRRQMW